MGRGSFEEQLASLQPSIKFEEWYERLSPADVGQALSTMIQLVSTYLWKSNSYSRFRQLNLSWSEADITKFVSATVFEAFKHERLRDTRRPVAQIVSDFLEAPWEERPGRLSRIAHIVDFYLARPRDHERSSRARVNPDMPEPVSDDLAALERNSELRRVREAGDAALGLLPTDQRYAARLRIALAISEEIAKPADEWSDEFLEIFMTTRQRQDLGEADPAQALSGSMGLSVEVNASALARWLRACGVEVTDKTAAAAWEHYFACVRTILQRNSQ